jgi:hypothetical protein
MDKEEKSYVCKKHYNHNSETSLSPCRGKPCNICKKRKPDGYTNPDHVSNPFGYLYLIPNICIPCAIEHKICMWCEVKCSKV